MRPRLTKPNKEQGNEQEQRNADRMHGLGRGRSGWASGRASEFQKKKKRRQNNETERTAQSGERRPGQRRKDKGGVPHGGLLEAHDLVRVKTRDWSRSDTVTMTKEK